MQHCPRCHKAIDDSEKIRFCKFCGCEINNEYISSLNSLDWIRDYRRIFLGEDRLKMIMQAKKNEIDLPNLDQYMLAFASRYKSKESFNHMIDSDLEIIQRLLFLQIEKSNLFNGRTKKGRRLIKKFLDTKRMAGIKDVSVLEDEVFNIFYSYINLCRNDKKFNSVILGIGKNKPSKTKDKIENELISIRENFTQNTDDEDLIMFDRAMNNAFLQYYCDYPVTDL